MSIARLRILPEVYIAVGFFALMLVVSLLLGLPISIPAGGSAAFVGVHYIYPLVGIGLLGVVTFFLGNRRTAIRFLLAMPCYALVLFAHFNFKLWIPFINPVSYDHIYWQIDQWLRPVVDFCFFARETIFGFIPYEANFYMLSFIGLFYVSFAYFAILKPESFGRLTVAVILQQALGSLAYMVAPALGPFIYEKGLNEFVSGGQDAMFLFNENAVTHGTGYLAQHGGEWFTAGLAAMPSLHTAGAVLFLLFAWREAKALVPIFAFAVVFILVTSVATRWHYIIDLPVGMLLAWFCYTIANKARDGRLAAPERQPAQSSVIGT